MEAAVVGGLVTQHQSELFFVLDRTGLEILSALAEPKMLGHAFDQDVFGRGGRLVLFGEAIGETFEFGRVLEWKQAKAGREAMAEIVLRRGSFTLGGFRTCAVLGIGSIGIELSLGCWTHGISPGIEVARAGRVDTDAGTRAGWKVAREMRWMVGLDGSVRKVR